MNVIEFAKAYPFSSDDQVFLRLALTANLFWSTDSAGPLGGIGPLLERFWPLIQPKASAYQTTWMKNAKKIDKKGVALIEDIMAGGIEPGFGTLIVDDRDGVAAAAANGIVITSAPHRGVGYLTIKLAPDFPADRFATELIAGTRSMQFLNGFGGFGLVYNDLDELASTAEAEFFPLGMRHPGLDLQSPSITSFSALSGIKCVNWLTFVGDGLSAKKLPNLKEGALGELMIRRQIHGWIIQAGQKPCIGDVNRRDACSAYIEAGRLLASIRANDHPDFILDEDLFMGSPERTNQWLSRFDIG